MLQFGNPALSLSTINSTASFSTSFRFFIGTFLLSKFSSSNFTELFLLTSPWFPNVFSFRTPFNFSTVSQNSANRHCGTNVVPSIAKDRQFAKLSLASDRVLTGFTCNRDHWRFLVNMFFTEEHSPGKYGRHMDAYGWHWAVQRSRHMGIVMYKTGGWRRTFEMNGHRSPVNLFEIWVHKCFYERWLPWSRKPVFFIQKIRSKFKIDSPRLESSKFIRSGDF